MLVKEKRVTTLYPTIDLGKTYGSLTYRLDYVTTMEQLAEATEWVKEQKLLLLDTETSGLSPYDDKIATIQVGSPLVKEPRAFVIDVRCFLPGMLDEFLEAVGDSKRAKLGQNVKFEYKFIRNTYGAKMRNLKDTQVTELCLRAGLFPSKGSNSGEEFSRAAYGLSSMDALTRRYLGITIDKDHELRISFYTTPMGTHNERQLIYAAGDVMYPAYIAMEQQKDVDARGLKDVMRIEHKYVHVLAEKEFVGFALDVDAWRSLWQEAVYAQAEAEKVVHALMLDREQKELFGTKSQYVLYPKKGERLNLNSGEQVKWFITAYCELIEWPVRIVTKKAEILALKRQYGGSHLDWMRTLSGKENDNAELTPESVERDEELVDRVPEHLIPNSILLLEDTQVPTLRLGKITGKLPKELVDALIGVAKYSNATTTFGKEFLKNVRADGRVHTEFHQVLDTGRTSSSPNLQNIPRDPRYRQCFIAPKGRKLVIADYSQIEPRITAQESKEPVYLNTFINDLDIYVSTGEVLLGQKIDRKTEQGEIYRQISKTIILGMAYRMGWYKLWKSIVLALEEPILAGKIEIPTYEYVQGLHKAFLEKLPKLKEYQELCSGYADPKKSTRDKIWDIMVNGPITWVEALCGRKRFFLSSAKNTYTEASNAPIQGHSATIIKVAEIMFEEECFNRNIDATIVNAVHDEIVVETAEEGAEQVALLLQDCMVRAGKFWLKDVPVKAEFPKNTNGVVDYWRK